MHSDIGWLNNTYHLGITDSDEGIKNILAVLMETNANKDGTPGTHLTNFIKAKVYLREKSLGDRNARTFQHARSFSTSWQKVRPWSLVFTGQRAADTW